MIDLGDPYTLTYPTKPASPATVTVTIGLPDMTTAGPFSATSGTYAYTTTQAGRHTVLWVSTGPSDAYSDAFDVAPSDPGFIISLADAKAQLRTTTTVNDEELRLYLAAVTGVVHRRCGQILPKTFTDVFEVADTIVLRHAPVISLTSVVPTFPADQAYQPIYPTYQLDGPSGICRAVPLYPYDFGWAPWPWNARTPFGLRLTFTYVAGQPVVPAALQVAAREILQDNWGSRRLAGPMPAGGDVEQMVDRLFLSERVQTLLETVSRGPRIV